MGKLIDHCRLKGFACFGAGSLAKQALCNLHVDTYWVVALGSMVY